MNEERERLIEELENIFSNEMRTYKPDYGCYDTCNAVADFIIADREIILKPYVEALHSLTDDDECSLDHHGYCQTHFSGSSPCLNKTALDLIKLSGVKI